MTFEELLELIKADKKEDAVTAITTLKGEFDTKVKEITIWEGKFNEAKTGRDKAKARLKEVNDTLGIGDDTTIEYVKKLVEKGKTDDTLKKEVENLQTILKTKEGEYVKTLSDKESQFKQKQVEWEISKAGVADAVNGVALNLVVSKAQEGASLEDGHIVYKNSDGTLKRNSKGDQLTPKDVIEALKADKEYSILFKSTAQGGGGANSGGGGGYQGKSLADAKTKEEKKAIIKQRMEGN